jgi:hypothetical protein
MADTRTGRLTCWECRHIDFTSGSPGYSEYTPGEDARLACNLNHWSMYDLDMNNEKIFSAETCADFQRPLTRKD